MQPTTTVSATLISGQLSVSSVTDFEMSHELRHRGLKKICTEDQAISGESPPVSDILMVYFDQTKCQWL